MAELACDVDDASALMQQERGEAVAEVVEFESGELFTPARLCVPGCTLDSFGENVGAKVVGVPDAVRTGRGEDEARRRRSSG